MSAPASPRRERPARPAPRLVDRSGPLSSGVPDDFYQLARRRVTIAGLAFAAVWAVILLASLLTRGQAADWFRESGWYRFELYIHPIGFAFSLFTAWIASRCDGSAEKVIRLGVLFMVVNAALIALPNQWGKAWESPAVSFAAVVVIVVPSIVPIPPRPMLLAGLLSASWDGIFRFGAIMAGASRPFLPAEWFWLVFPNMICVALAMVPTHVMRNLGQAVREARDLGNYRLGALLGKGGMGEVYEASHRLLARAAAVKVIAPQHLVRRDPAALGLLLERFRREASAAANLRSPNTIELFDFGTTDDGSLFYAMELLDGLTLQQLVERHGPQPPGRVIHFLRQACRSLAEAHGQGLVHRDVKPSNLMACRMGTEVDFLKVLDFGLVKASVDRSAALTADDVTAGTPAFMPPEAIEGVHGLDHRADIYALGCVAFWLLTGRPVFDGNNALAILVKHGREAPPPLSGTVEPVAADFERLIYRCLAKDPSDRPGDALSLHRDLGACVQAAEWGAESAEAWWAAHRPVAAPATLAAA